MAVRTARIQMINAEEQERIHADAAHTTKSTSRRRGRSVAQASTYRAAHIARRNEFVDLVNAKLVRASHISSAKMKWTVTSFYGTPDITFKYRVALRGWPEADIPFGICPSNMSLGILEMLIKRFKNEETYLEKMSDTEYEAREAQENRQHRGGLKGAYRVDTGRRRLRGEATRSKKLRKFDLKTTRLTIGRED